MSDRKKVNPLRLSTAGVEFITIFGILLAAGYFLDRWTGWTPAGTVWGAMLGFGVAMYRLLKQAQAAKHYTDEEEEEGQEREEDDTTER